MLFSPQLSKSAADLNKGDSELPRESTVGSNAVSIAAESEGCQTSRGETASFPWALARDVQVDRGDALAIPGPMFSTICGMLFSLLNKANLVGLATACPRREFICLPREGQGAVRWPGASEVLVCVGRVDIRCCFKAGPVEEVRFEGLQGWASHAPFNPLLKVKAEY